MIRIYYARNRRVVTVQGHAETGEAGRDLLCAGVTALTRTLAANAARLEELGVVSGAEIVLKPGDARIHCPAVGKYEAVTTMIYDAVCIGFDLLAQKYPEHISYQVVG